MHLLENSKKRQIQDAVRKIGDDAADATEAIVVFFFSGHGEDIQGENYLMPCEVIKHVEDDAYPLNHLIKNLNRPNTRTKTVVLLDCCHQNDEDGTWKSGMKARGMTSRGLSAVQLATDCDFMFGYGCHPGTVSFEPTEGPHGYFTDALLKHLDATTPVDRVLLRVRKEVFEKTEKAQKPWGSGAPMNIFNFAGQVVDE